MGVGDPRAAAGAWLAAQRAGPAGRGSLAQLNQGLSALLAVVAPDDRQGGMQPFPFTM